MAYQAPVIVIPGITASYLRDEYPLDPETVWAILRKSYERTALHPDDPRYELVEPARVVPDKVFGLPYTEFIQELRHDLSQRADEPTPVYAFAYDWRQPLDWIEARLAEFVDEVIARTRLMRHYHSAGFGDDPRVDLVGHSMGSLIIAGYLESNGAEKIGKVVTLGAPFRGSFEAVLKVATGNADLGAGRSSSREREVARLTPALYHLLPRYRGAVNVAEGLERDLFKAGAWQPSVVQTLAEYIRLHGVERRMSGARRLEMAGQLFGNMLTGARKHRRRLERLDLAAIGMSVDDWLCVIGVGEETRVRLRINKFRGAPVFDLDSTDRENGYVKPEDRDHTTPRLWHTGDGTVPYEGAEPAFLPLEKLVCVMDDDFGYWELGDRALDRFGVSFHAILPKMNLIHRLVVTHFRAPKGTRARANRGVWGRRPPRLAMNADWDPPIQGLEERSIFDS